MAQKESGMRTLKGPEMKKVASSAGAPVPKDSHRIGRQPEESGAQTNIHTNFLPSIKQTAAGRTKAAGFDVAASGKNIGDGIRVRGMVPDENKLFAMVRASSNIGPAQKVTPRKGDVPLGSANKPDAPKGR
jgi:hypothetical protein